MIGYFIVLGIYDSVLNCIKPTSQWGLEYADCISQKKSMWGSSSEDLGSVE